MSPLHCRRAGERARPLPLLRSCCIPQATAAGLDGAPHQNVAGFCKGWGCTCGGIWMCMVDVVCVCVGGGSDTSRAAAQSAEHAEVWRSLPTALGPFGGGRATSIPPLVFAPNPGNTGFIGFIGHVHTLHAETCAQRALFRSIQSPCQLASVRGVGRASACCVSRRALTPWPDPGCCGRHVWCHS